MKVSMDAGQLGTPRASLDAGRLIVVPVFQGVPIQQGLNSPLNEATDGALSAAIERRVFAGKRDEVLTLDSGSGRVMVVGLGPAKEFGPLGLRRYGAHAARHAATERFREISIVPPLGTSDVPVLPYLAVLHTLVGLRTAAYDFTTCKSPPKEGEPPRTEIDEVYVTGLRDEPAPAGMHPIERAAIFGDAIVHACEVTNLPANKLTPELMAQSVREMCAASEGRLEVVRIMNLAEMEGAACPMGGIVAVGRGSEHEPRFIHFRYAPRNGTAKSKIVFVGKGLCHDSGGLSLKPPVSQADMFIDKGGAAAVLGSAFAVSQLELDVEVHFIIGAAINAVGSRAYNPGDIVRMRNGLRVEVTNTDAEGRLVLGDCIDYAEDLNPDIIIDLATLTGAQMVGGGINYAGLWTNDPSVDLVMQAAARTTGELIWPMTPDRSLAGFLQSGRADLVNVNMAMPYGGAIFGALFLERFIRRSPWAHIDLAGPVHRPKADGPWAEGATGFGVLTLVEIAERAARGELDVHHVI